MKELLRIISYSKKLWPYYAAISFFVIIIALLSLVTPYIIKVIVDLIVTKLQGKNVAISFIIWLVFLIFVANVVRILLSNLNGYLGDMLSVKLNTLLSVRYYQKLLNLPLEYFDNEITGKITSRLDRAVFFITQLMQTLANNFVQFFLTTLFTLIFIAFYSWPVALMLAIIIPTYIWLTYLSSKEWNRRQKPINRDIDYSVGRFIESIGQIRVVKSFISETLELAIFKKKRRSIEAKTKVQSIKWHKYDALRQFSLGIIFFFIYGFIFWQTFNSHYSLGTMTLLLQLSLQAQMPLFGSSFIVESIQRAQAGSRDYFRVMDIPLTAQDSLKVKDLRIKKGEIEFRNVSFSYNDGKKILKDLNFTISPGEKVALIGESGEGKTTIVNLLLRFYEPSSGKILIDGLDIKEFSLKSLRRAIGVVFQDPSLFSGTVAENIAYGKLAVNKKRLIAAARAANADDFITQLPKGYDSQIGERGVKLSGGQKQRIAIARTILKNPPILILDEATSSLDSKAEKEVQNALNHLMSGRSTLIIAHRLSTISNVDKIIAIKNGQIVEQGSPMELSSKKGIYSELLSLQIPTKINKAKLKKFDIAQV